MNDINYSINNVYDKKVTCNITKSLYSACHISLFVPGDLSLRLEILQIKKVNCDFYHIWLFLFVIYGIVNKSKSFVSIHRNACMPLVHRYYKAISSHFTAHLGTCEEAKLLVLQHTHQSLCLCCHVPRCTTK